MEVSSQGQSPAAVFPEALGVMHLAGHREPQARDQALPEPLLRTDDAAKGRPRTSSRRRWLNTLLRGGPAKDGGLGIGCCCCWSCRPALIASTRKGRNQISVQGCLRESVNHGCGRRPPCDEPELLAVFPPRKAHLGIPSFCNILKCPSRWFCHSWTKGWCMVTMQLLQLISSCVPGG